jgi:UPF0755 protein
VRILPIFALLATAAVLFGGVALTSRVPAFAIGQPSASLGPAAPASNQTVTFTVNPGESALTISNRLRQAGIIQSTELFDELTALEGLQNGLASGQYDLSPNLPASEIIARLHAGAASAFKVTIPEGKRVEEVAAILQQAGVVQASDFLAALKTGGYKYDFLSGEPPGANLEGFIFPDTYAFPKHNTAADVVNLMLKDFGDRVTPDLRAAFQQEGLSINQAVTLASIVEREAQDPSERPLIASVFFNRMKAGMPLQSDPTVQFALAADPKSVAEFGWWKQDLTLDDLKIASPYNTYTNPGLPPGPIANPGLASLQAVAHPAQTKYLYFVAKGDGSHVFAETFAEHQANIAKYQH